ncbi:MAG: zf-HC2 domain-containing protein [Aeromicrobium sp.]
MTTTHEELRDALGPYALGQLDDEVRQEVDAHLATCAACRAQLAELTPLADLLGGVDVERIRPVGAGTPPELDERIRRALPGRPRRVDRWLSAGVAAAVAAVAVAVTVLVVREESPTVIAVPGLTAVDGVTATAGLVDHTWGLEIKLEATGLRAGERFEVWVLGEDGRSYDAGTFVGVADTRIICDMSSSVLLDDAASFRVVDAAGVEVIAAALPHPS